MIKESERRAGVIKAWIAYQIDDNLDPGEIRFHHSIDGLCLVYFHPKFGFIGVHSDVMRVPKLGLEGWGISTDEFDDFNAGYNNKERYPPKSDGYYQEGNTMRLVELLRQHDP
jgi:hypothetical protein